MQAQKHSHHLHIGAICFVPLFLMAFAALWSTVQVAPALAQYDEYANRAEQKLQLLDTKFRGMQRTYSLLTTGKEKEMYKPITYHHTQNYSESALERYSDTQQHIDTLEERIRAFRGNINKIGEKIIHINLSEQEALLVQDGEIVARYPVSSGAWETPTPVGKFEIHRKQTLRVSSQEIPYRMPNYMAFTPSGSHGLHALPYLGDGPQSSNYWYEALDHIGIPVSHGCVRLLPEDAKKLFDEIEVGVPVIINA